VYAIFGFLILLMAISAYAADYTAGTKCPAKVNHEPMENLEYQAGVDASGYAVAPAEEMPPPLSADDFSEVKMPLNIPMGQYADTDKYNVNAERMELNAGEVSVDAKTGGVTFNGKDISTTEPTLADPDCMQ